MIRKVAGLLLVIATLALSGWFVCFRPNCARKCSACSRVACCDRTSFKPMLYGMFSVDCAPAKSGKSKRLRNQI